MLQFNQNVNSFKDVNFFIYYKFNIFFFFYSMLKENNDLLLLAGQSLYSCFLLANFGACLIMGQITWIKKADWQSGSFRQHIPLRPLRLAWLVPFDPILSFTPRWENIWRNWLKIYDELMINRLKRALALISFILFLNGLMNNLFTRKVYFNCNFKYRIFMTK